MVGRGNQEVDEKKSKIVLLVFVLMDFSAGCSVRGSGHYGDHAHHSRGSYFSGQKDDGLEVSLRSRALKVSLQIRFPAQIRVQFLNHDGKVVWEDAGKGLRKHFQLPAHPGGWTVRLTAREKVTGEYQCRIIAR